MSRFHPVSFRPNLFLAIRCRQARLPSFALTAFVVCAGAKKQNETKRNETKQSRDKESYAFVGDARGHAQNYIPTTRTWSNSTFLAGLSSGRSEEEKEAIVEEMFQGYAAKVAAAPEDHGMDYVHAYLHAEKPAK